MALGASVAVPPALYLLTHVDGVVTRWVIVAIVVALLMPGLRYHGRPHALLSAAFS